LKNVDLIITESYIIPQLPQTLNTPQPNNIK